MGNGAFPPARSCLRDAGNRVALRIWQGAYSPAAWVHPRVQYPAYLDFSQLNHLLDDTGLKKAEGVMATCAAKLNSTEGDRLMINECEALVWASVPPPDK